MKVKDLIEELQKFDPELSVCLYDWQEEYEPPSESAAEEVSLAENCRYIPTNASYHKTLMGTFICIGGKI